MKLPARVRPAPASPPTPTPTPTGTIATGTIPLPSELASATLRAFYCDITPEDAARLLAVNSANRTPRTARIEQYARDHTEGNFLPNSDAISVYTSGKLANGQHRLLMVVKTGLPLFTLVVLGLPEESALYQDRPAMRRVDDNFQIAGRLQGIESDATRPMVSLANFVISQGAYTPTMSQLNWVIGNIGVSLHFALTHLASGPESVAIAPVRAGIAMAHACGVDEAVLARFTEALRTGITAGTHEGVIPRLTEKLKKLGSDRAARIDACHLTQTAIKFFVAGINPSKLVTVSSDVYALPEMEVFK